MAKKRMFSLSVLDTDAFLDLPLSAQALYFHLNLHADDDGFIGNPKRVANNIGASLDDLRLLVLKRFVIAFEDGVIVIKHWRMHNAIKSDRYTQTNYIEDFAMLGIKANGAYTLTDGTQMENKWSANGTQMLQTCSADKNRLDKDIGLDNSFRLGECEGEGEVIFELLTKEGDIFPVYQSMIDHYSKLYPNIDVRQEFRSMQGWCEANDKNRKTFKGMKRFINGWLNRAKPKEKSFIEAAAELEKEGWEF